MKAKFFFLGLCALALAACSLDEVSQVNDTNAIKFKATTATRATAVTTNNLTEFSVWAWNTDNYGVTNEFMDDVIATKGSNGTFTTSPLYFWPTGTVDFYALVPSTTVTAWESVNGVMTEYAYLGGKLETDHELTEDGTPWVYTGNVAQAQIENGNIVIDAYIPSHANEQIDLCYAVATEKSSGSVAMNFRHALSQVAFKVTNSNPEFVVDIDEISLCSVYKEGTFTIGKADTDTNLPTADTGISDEVAATQGTWVIKTSDTEQQVKARYVPGITPTVLTGTEDGVVDVTTDPLMLLPQTVVGWDVYTDQYDKDLGSYIRISCHVTENGSQLWPNANEADETTKEIPYYAEIAVPITDAVWEQGYRYTYTLIFGEGIGYYPPDDPNYDLDGTPILVPINFTVTVDEFQDASNSNGDYDVTTNTGVVKTAADLKAAVAAQYSPIEIAADIELDGYLEFNYDCELTIDKGCTLTGPDATVKDSGDNAIQHSDNTTDYTAIIYVNGGNLTIYGEGTVATGGSNSSDYTNAIWVVDGSVTIYGGTYKGSNWDGSTSSNYVKQAVYCGEGGYAYIYGGDFYAGKSTHPSAAAGDDGYAWVLNCHNSSWEDGHAMIYCYGGTYHDGFDPSDLHVDDAASYVAEGYSSVDNGDGTYTVILTTVATPADLAAALAAGASEITVSESFSIEQESGSGYFWSYNDCTITLEDGVTISLDEMSSIANYAFFIAKSGTLTIEGNGTLKSNGSTQDMGCMCFWLDGGDVVINGGNFYSAAWAEESSSDTAACVYVNLGTATINGGSFYGSHNVTAYTGSSYLLNCTDKNYSASPRTADIIVYGGAFCDFDPADNYAEGANTNFCATGYTTVKSDETDSDGWYWYTVVEDKD